MYINMYCISIVIPLYFVLSIVLALKAFDNKFSILIVQNLDEDLEFELVLIIYFFKISI